MQKTRLRKYAHLLAVSGLNIQKGQEVVIRADLDQPEFVKTVVEECYKAGAGKVIVDWGYSPLTKLHVRYQKLKTLEKIEEWELARLEHRATALPCMLYLTSEDPDGLAGIDQKKLLRMMRARSKATKPYRSRMENRYQWCIAGVPGKDWAKKVFPNDRVNVAMEKLWEAILTTARVTDDPVKAWEEHNADLAARCKYLTDLHLSKLVYKSKNGTDFCVGLIPGARFCAGKEDTIEGLSFNPNIPSEEVFTSPMSGVAEGVVHSSLPLSHNGQLVDHFWLKFEGGKVVDCGAETGEQVLRDILAMDEGAAKLGECALVPFTSPIRNSGVLFYNTLYDENAACHLALGRGFPEVLPGFETRSEEDTHKMGINDSLVHVDFMIGNEDLDITGITEDGKEIPIFRKGEWAF